MINSQGLKAMRSFHIHTVVEMSHSLNLQSVITGLLKNEVDLERSPLVEELPSFTIIPRLLLFAVVLGWLII